MTEEERRRTLEVERQRYREIIRRGMEVERERFRSKPFVVVKTCHEFDYDGLRQSIDLLEGFPVEAEAVEYAQGQAAIAQRTAEAKPGYGNAHWQVFKEDWLPMLDQRHDNEFVRCLHQERFKATNGSGYDFEYIEFAVLQITAADVIGPELVDYLGMRWEVDRYFSKCGKMSSREAVPGAAVDGVA